jgi:primosomal replication protein N
VTASGARDARMAINDANRVVLGGTLAGRAELRSTPAGVPLVRAEILHRSTQHEAGAERTVEAAIDAVALGDTALALAAIAPGRAVEVTGFLAPRTRNDRRLELHLTGISAG